MANEPKGIKIEAWQAGPSSSGKTSIYLINSVPKQQPTWLTRRARPDGVCEPVHILARPEYMYTSVGMDKHTDLPPTENIYSGDTRVTLLFFPQILQALKISRSV